MTDQQVEGITSTAPTPVPITANSYWEPLDFYDVIFSRPFHILGHNWIAFMTIALVFSGLRAVLAFVFDVANGPGYGADYGAEVDYGGSYGENDYQNVDVMKAATITMSLVNSMILFVVMCLVDGAGVHIVANLYASGQQIQPLSPIVAIGTVVQKLVPLVGSCLLVFTAIYLVFAFIFGSFVFLLRSGYLESAFTAFRMLMLLSIPISMYISSVTFLMYPTIIVEGRSIMGSIERSIQLTEDYVGKIFLIIVIYSLIKMGVAYVIVTVTLSGSQTAIILRGLLSFCANTFYIAIFAILKAVIYFDVRSKKEQLTEETLKTEMGSSNAYATMEETEPSATTQDIEMM